MFHKKQLSVRIEKLFSVGIGIAGLALGVSTAAMAQQREAETQEASQATEQSDIEKYKKVRDMSAITVTATRHEEKILDVPATVNVITRQQMDDQLAINPQELVRHQSGIQVNRQVSGTDPYANLSGYVIRGVGDNRVQIQVDGARIIERSLDGNRDFVDLSMMKSVEIMRGPGSVLWGADALGGIVSYQTLDPDDLLRGRQFGGNANMGFDSVNNAFSRTAMVAGQFSPTLQGLFGYTYRTYSETKLSNARADGGRWGCTRVAIGCDELNPLDGNTNNALGKLVWRPNAQHEVKLTGEYFRSDVDVKQMYDYGIATATLRNGDYPRNQQQTRQRAALEHNWNVDSPALDNLKWRLSYSPQKRQLDTTRYQTNLPANTPRTTSEKTDYEEDFLQADIQMTSSFDWGNSQHTLTYGFQGDTTDTSYKRRTVLDNNGKVTTTYGGGSNFADSTTTRADVYFQDEIKLFDDRLILTPGVRYATYSIDPDYDSNYKVIPGKEPKKRDAQKWIPQLGLLFRLTEQYSLYGRYAEGFKMPTAQDLYTSVPSAMGTFNMVPNPNLKPEEVVSYEAGIRGKFEDGWFSFGAFYSDYTDFIKSRQLVPGTASDYTSRNLSKVKLWGLEASGEWQFARHWSVNANASYQYGKEREYNSNDYNPFSGASPLSAVVGLKWNEPSLGLSSQLVGTFSKGVTRTTSDANYQPGGYSVFDAYVSWQIDKTFRLSASVLNIFDKRYYSYTAATLDDVPASAAVAYTNPLELYTQPGRTFGINLSASF